MKKIISLALAFMMIATMSTTAFAADIKQDSEDKTGTTDITYTVSDSYIVTIPDSMTIGTDATVSVKDVVLAKDYDLTVSVSSKNNWKLKNAEVDSIDYTLKIGDTTIANNGTVLTAKSGETATKTLVTAVPKNQKPKYSGSYTDTLTFAVAVKFAYNATSVSAEELKTALAVKLAAGETGIVITMPANPDDDMFTAIRDALSESEADDGSIDLTLKGTTKLSAFMLAKYESLGYEQELANCMDKLRSISLPDATEIDAYAFRECKSLVSVYAPKVTTIGAHAFSYADSLKTVDLPEVTAISYQAFQSCTALTSVNIPKATKIEDGAFSNCTAMTSLELPSVTDIEERFINGSSALTVLKLTAEGNMEVATNANNDAFNAFKNAPTKNINLYLNIDKQAEVTDGNTWHGYTFKSITFVDTTN